MVSVWVATLLAIGASVAGGVGAYILRSRFEAKKLKEAQDRAAQIVAETQEQGKKAQIAAKEEALKLRSEAEMDIRRSRADVQKLERRVMNREENLERRYEALEKKERNLVLKEQDMDAQKAKMEQLHQEELAKLEKLSGLSQQEVRDLILQKTEQQMQEELARLYWEKEQAMKEEANTQARKIITTAIQRLASDVVSETTVSVVPIPNDEMKGRLIGREGRNIRALENATGVELIVDDTPEAVTLSCFDPVRREIARVAVIKLISDGRIHPARIEEVVNKAQEEVDETIRKAGEQAMYDGGVGGLNPELVKLLGRLKYRYSYGHNVLNHCVEVALLAGMMASEIGANAKIARAGGLLHDIGKALTHEVEGTHAEIGADVARKYGIAPEIYRAIMEHHDEEMSSVEAHLVACADAISGARPGARKDTFEQYVKRLTALEDVAKSFEGVEKCYAIQAGREIRIMVKPHQIDDPGAAQLAREVAKKIQKELVFPGQIKVVVIRETRSVEIAK